MVCEESIEADCIDLKPEQNRDGEKNAHQPRRLKPLLDENDTSLTLTALANAAAVLGKTLKVELAVA